MHSAAPIGTLPFWLSTKEVLEGYIREVRDSMADEGAAITKAVWFDCDPGHDDAIALLLAFWGGTASAPALKVLGVSTTHGNTTGENTYKNAVKLLEAYGIDQDTCRVWRGADLPLLRPGKVDVGIHGQDGLGGVEGLPNPFAGPSVDVNEADPGALVAYQIALLKERRKQKAPKISLIATGPLTNVALLIKSCPGDGSLLVETIDEIVVMGGAAGSPGNRSPLAEWNILVDPEAAAIVFDSPLPVVMAGLNITHQAIFTPALLKQLDEMQRSMSPDVSSPIFKIVRTAIMYFANSYRDEFGFANGPPLHDLLCSAYVLDPSLFYALQPRPHAPFIDQTQARHLTKAEPSRYQVRVDTSQGLADGATIVDFYAQWPLSHRGWHRGGLNAVILEYVDTDRLWPLLFKAIERRHNDWLSKQSGKT